MENREPTPEDYLKWYNEGYITIFPLLMGNQLILMVIPIPQK